MKHPSWCEQDDCEEGWHMASASFSNDGLAQIQVRLSEEINTGKQELDLGKGDGSFNSVTTKKDIEQTISDLREFRDQLSTLIEGADSK
jgi:hypothetical protein